MYLVCFWQEMNRHKKMVNTLCFLQFWLIVAFDGFINPWLIIASHILRHNGNDERLAGFNYLIIKTD